MIFHCLCLILVSFFILSETKQPSEKDAIELLKVAYRYPELRLIHNDFNNLLPYYLNYEIAQPKLGYGTVGNSPKIPSAFIPFWKKGISDIISDTVKEFKIITNNYLPTGHKCGDDILYTISSAMSMDMWAIQMLDASGKPSAGIMLGGTTWLGNEKECKEVYAPAKTIGSIHFGGFNGIQCLVDWSANLPPPMNQRRSFKTGVCLPDSCSSGYLNNVTLNFKQLKQLFNITEPFFDNKTNQTLQVKGVDCSDHVRSWTGGDITYMCILALLCALVIVGTVCDIENSIRREKVYVSLENQSRETVCNQHDNQAFKINENENDAQNTIVDVVKEELSKDQVPASTEVNKSNPSKHEVGFIKELLICFSLYTNITKLISVRNQQGQLSCLHGIRFLSMTWIILGHSFVFSITALGNTMDLLVKVVNSFSFLAVSQGTYSVDTFFFLSGFLLAYLFLKEYGKSDKSVNWLYYYVHRIWRLSPAFFMLLGFYTTVWLHLGYGPFWPTKTDNGGCEKNWWWAMLYISNFQKKDSAMCMGWTWYLANDMQFYVISPLFLIFLWKSPIVGNLLVGAVMVASWIATCIISVNNHFSLKFDHFNENPQRFFTDEAGSGNLFSDIYIKPYCRIGAYLVGILFGYALYKTDGRQKFMKPWMYLIGWSIALFLFGIIVFGPYHSNMGEKTLAAYNGLSRTAWTIAVGWVVFACLTGSGGPVNTLLSWEFWVPLSRLTYCAYLVHPMIMYWYFFSVQSILHYEYSTWVLYYFGFILASYLAAFVASLVLESPMMALEKCILKRFSRN